MLVCPFFPGPTFRPHSKPPLASPPSPASLNIWPSRASSIAPTSATTDSLPAKSAPSEPCSFASPSTTPSAQPSTATSPNASRPSRRPNARANPLADSPRTIHAPTEPRNGATRVSKRFPLVRDQPVLGDKAPRKTPSRRKRIFRDLLKSAHRPPPAKPQKLAPAPYEVFAPTGMTRAQVFRGASSQFS